MYNNCNVSLMYKIINKWKILCDNWFIKSLTVYIFSFIGNQLAPKKMKHVLFFSVFFLFVCLFVWFFFYHNWAHVSSICDILRKYI